MPKPKGFKKNLLLNKVRIGRDRRDDLLEDVRENTAYLPKGIMYEDMDRTFIEFANDELSITIDDEKVPVIFLTLQRWSEFARTWQDSDDYGNIKIPFITVVRNPAVQQGENQGNLWNIPGNPTFNYLKVPNNKNGRLEVDIYKIPQPTPVDVTYEVRFFGNRMRDLNKINKKIQQLFKSRQHYIRPNEHFMPLHLESISDESEITDVNKRRYYVQLFEIKLLGYLLDEDDFEVKPAINRILLMNEFDENKNNKLK